MSVGPLEGNVQEKSGLWDLELRRKFWAGDMDLGASVWMPVTAMQICVEF